LSSTSYIHLGDIAGGGKLNALTSRSTAVAQDRAIGGRLREMRKRLGLTQQEFAERLGLRRLSVARYEAGRVPRVDILKEIARAGGVSVASLISAESESTASPAQSSVSPAQIPIPLMRLLRRLRRQIEAINALQSPTSRRSYEHRSKIILSRAIRDLADYRALVERHSRRHDSTRHRS
jgi:transcriptional regulator with XRE-family HTH domain